LARKPQREMESSIEREIREVVDKVERNSSEERGNVDEERYEGDRSSSEESQISEGVDDHEVASEERRDVEIASEERRNIELVSEEKGDVEVACEERGDVEVASEER